MVDRHDTEVYCPDPDHEAQIASLSAARDALDAERQCPSISGLPDRHRDDMAAGGTLRRWVEHRILMAEAMKAAAAAEATP